MTPGSSTPPTPALRVACPDDEAAACSAAEERFGYVPCLDGLRAVSILLVLAFHGMGPVSILIARACAGWVGVDIFFVISGFLITSILLQEEKDVGTFSLSRFYVRRSLRIWPAYYAFLLVVGLTGYSHWASIGICSIYLTNFDLALGWNIFEPAKIGHLWSLAVEEQFYLLWPLALSLAGRVRLPLGMGLMGAVWIWRTVLIAQGASWQRLCAGIDTRLDALMVGCVGAMIWASPAIGTVARRCASGKWTPLIATGALIASAMSLGHPGDYVHRPAQLFFWNVKLPAFTLLTMVLILVLLAQPRSRISRIMGHSTLVWIGRLSYSLYLWHVVAFKILPKAEVPFLHNLIPGWPMASYLLASLPAELARLALSLVFASASYYLIERPCLSLKRRWESRGQFGDLRRQQPEMGDASRLRIADLDLSAAQDERGGSARSAGAGNPKDGSQQSRKSSRAVA